MQTLEGCFSRITRRPGNELDKRRSEVSEGLGRVDSVSLFFSSKPVSNSLGMTIMQVFLLAMHFFSLQGLLSKHPSLMRNGAHNGTHYKFTALQLRHGPSLSISDSGVSHLGLLWYGQEIDSRTKNLTFRGTEVLLCGRERHTMNGFFFVTTYNDPALDPVVFSLSVSDDGVQWERIFHSRSENGWPGSIIPYSSKTTMKRGAMEVLDLRFTWSWLLHRYIPLIWSVVCVLAVQILSWMGHMEAATSILGVWMIIIAILQMAASIGEDSEAKVILIMNGLSILPLGLSFLLFERLFLVGLWSNGVLDFFLGVAKTVMSGVLSEEVMMNHILLGIAKALWGFGMYRYFRLLQRKAITKVTVDKVAFDEAWERLIQTEESRAEIHALATAVHDYASRTGAARQMVARRIPNLGLSRSASASRIVVEMIPRNLRYGILEEQGDVFPVESLDTLMTQASFVHSILLRKVLKLARDCRGMFPVKQELRQPKEHFAFLESTSMHRLMFASMKQESRAIEKALRSYRNDVSFLTDLARQSIVFEKVVDLRMCFDAIHQDPDLIVVRLKNRLDSQYDSWGSLGYRDLAINLKISCDETRRLGVDNHIAELQLIPVEMAQLKGEGSHRRYVEYRNTMAE